MDYTDIDGMELLALMFSMKYANEKADRWNAPSDTIDMVEDANGKFTPNGLTKKP